MQRLKTRAQFQAAMAGGTVSRTPHFVLHRASLESSPPAGSEPEARSRTLFAVRDEPYVGVVLPKRWARRAVTRNGIKRQVYDVSSAFAPRLTASAHVVRLRMDFARKDFPSAWSDALKAVVRAELLQLFERATLAKAAKVADAGASASPATAAPSSVTPVSSSVTPAKAGAQGSPVIPAKAGIQGSQK